MKKKKSKRKIFMSFARTIPLMCPHCRATLHSVEGLSFRRPVHPRPGDITLCAECRTWLAFEATSLRRATPAEIDRIDPTLRKYIELSVDYMDRQSTKH